jgi:hypothetical protein
MISTGLSADNLYKFVAIAGLSIVLLSFYLLHVRSDRDWERMIQADKQWMASMDELKQLTRTRSKLRQETSPKTRAIADADDEFKKRVVQIRQQTQEEYLSRAPTLRLFDELQLALYGGLVFIGMGLTLWYFRVQRYLDIAVKKQSVTG